VIRDTLLIREAKRSTAQRRHNGVDQFVTRHAIERAKEPIGANLRGGQRREGMHQPDAAMRAEFAETP